MKKILFTLLTAGIALASISCGNKTAAGEATDSLAVADSAVITDTSADDKEIIEQLSQLFLPDNSPVYSEEWLKKHCSEQCLATLHKVYNKTMPGAGYYGMYLLGQEDGVGFSADLQDIQKVEHNGKQLFRERIHMMEQSGDEEGLYTLVFVNEVRDVLLDCSLKDGEVFINSVEWEQTPMKYEKLPAKAELVGEGKGYKAYTRALKSGDEDSPVELWLTDADGKYAKKLLTTTEKLSEVDWKEAKEYPITSIASVTAVNFFVYAEDETEQTYMVIQGCPDSRNVFTYILPVSLSPSKALFIPAAEGFDSYDETRNVIKCSGYGYHDEGGRYTIHYEYDINGKLLHKANGDDE